MGKKHDDNAYTPPEQWVSLEQEKILAVLYNERMHPKITVKELEKKLFRDKRTILRSEKMLPLLRDLESKKLIHLEHELPEIIDGMQISRNILSAKISELGIDSLILDSNNNVLGVRTKKSS